MYLEFELVVDLLVQEFFFFFKFIFEEIKYTSLLRTKYISWNYRIGWQVLFMCFLFNYSYHKKNVYLTNNPGILLYNRSC